MKNKFLLCSCICGSLFLSGCSGSSDTDTSNESTNQPENAPNTAPIANFSYEIDGQTVKFINTSSDPEGDDLIHNWAFGSAGQSTEFEPSVNFATGSHVVVLTVSDGNLSHSFEQSLQVDSANSGNIIQAEDYNELSGSGKLSNDGTRVTHLKTGDYLVFKAIDLTDISQISSTYSSESEGAHIEFRLDNSDGQLIASTPLPRTNDWQTLQTAKALLLNPISGTQDLYVVMQGAPNKAVANLDHFELSDEQILAVENTPYLLDEDSHILCTIHGKIDNKHSGFRGSGFIDTDNSLGASIAWNIWVDQTGIYPLELRFANGSDSARSGSVKVNGVASQAVELLATGDWDQWQTEYLRVSLEAGNNQISLTATGVNGLANLDQILIIGEENANLLVHDGECQTVEFPNHSGSTLAQTGNPVHSQFNKYKTQWNKDKADIILSYQYDNGGWPKNNEYTQMGSGGSGVGSTIDNGATTLEMSFLADLYRQEGDVRYRDSVRKAMDYLLAAQYDTGGWPQFYPLKGGYADHATYNDDAMVRVLTLLHYAAQSMAPFDTDIFTDADRLKFEAAINKGIDYILKSQWKQNGVLTVWCAQHGALDYLPKKARAYELESLSGSESTGIIGFLMTQPQSEAIKASVDAALAWYRSPNTILADHKYDKSTEEKIVPSEGDRIWYRFYDLETNQGFFSDRDSGTYYDLMDISEERRNGYSWGGGYAESILNYADSVGY